MLGKRIEKLKKAYLKATPMVSSERSRLYTEYFKGSDGEPILIRRAKAFRHVLNHLPIADRDGELIVGSRTPFVRGAFAYTEFSSKWLKEEINTLSQRTNQALEISEEDKAILLKDIDYWLGKCVEDRAEELQWKKFNSRIKDAKESRVMHDTSPHPQARMVVDYPKVLSKGLTGIIEETQDKIRRLAINSYEDLQKHYFGEAVVIANKAVVEFVERHADLAAQMAIVETNVARKKELLKIKEVCEWVPANVPRNFHEAIQAFWFVHLALQIENNAVGYSLGRFDQYMYPFYVNDVQNGTLTANEAKELIACLWIKLTEIETLKPGRNSLTSAGNMYQNLTIAGQTKEGQDATNELSYLILEVTKELKLIQPTISVRYFDGLEERLLIKAAEVVQSGGGMPAFFNDKTALASMPHLGIPLNENREYVPIGCVERGIPGSTVLLAAEGFVSLPKCLELTLYNGVDPRSEKRIGLKTGNPGGFDTFEELMEAFKKQLSYHIETVVHAYNTSYSFHPDSTPIPFTSSLINDCIDKGKDITSGGGRYNHLVSLFPFGIINTGNSLTAIKKLIYEEKRLEFPELLEALKANFEGKEKIRNLLLAAPKYGNDDDVADRMVNELFKICIDIVEHFPNPWGKPLTAGFLGITMHYYFGSYVGALPDGRKAYTPLSDGSLSPFPGTDKRGPTAVLKSASKIDSLMATATLLNMKIHPHSLGGKQGLKKLISLIKTYFDLYGWHIQFNVFKREELIAAQKDPQRYRDLIVRVAGFSAFWIDLAEDVQNEILARTEFEI
jgi:formate C-acetyltransferase